MRRSDLDREVPRAGPRRPACRAQSTSSTAVLPRTSAAGKLLAPTTSATTSRRPASVADPLRSETLDASVSSTPAAAAASRAPTAPSARTWRASRLPAEAARNGLRRREDGAGGGAVVDCCQNGAHRATCFHSSFRRSSSSPAGIRREQLGPPRERESPRADRRRPAGGRGRSLRSTRLPRKRSAISKRVPRGREPRVEAERPIHRPDPSEAVDERLPERRPSSPGAGHRRSSAGEVVEVDPAREAQQRRAPGRSVRPGRSSAAWMAGESELPWARARLVEVEVRFERARRDLVRHAGGGA